MKILFVESYRIPEDQNIMPWFFNLLPFIAYYSKEQSRVVSIAFGWLWWSWLLYDFDKE